MKISALFLFALALPPLPARAQTTVLDYTGVTITQPALVSLFDHVTGHFVLKNGTPKDIIYVQVRCTVASATGQTIQGKTTLNDVGSGKTAEGQVFFTPEPTDADDKVSCAPFDLFVKD